MKNFGFFSLIFLLCSVSQADTIESGYRTIATAWARQTGIELELTNSGNHIYKTLIEEKYRAPLAFSAQVVHSIHVGRIQINIEWKF